MVKEELLLELPLPMQGTGIHELDNDFLAGGEGATVGRTKAAMAEAVTSKKRFRDNYFCSSGGCLMVAGFGLSEGCGDSGVKGEEATKGGRVCPNGHDKVDKENDKQATTWSSKLFKAPREKEKEEMTLFYVPLQREEDNKPRRGKCSARSTEPRPENQKYFSPTTS
ncbi:hypothetical protein NE237_004909 [Protea cynaroides]|uniref:Uncharacterized protein n=1 Tax=Protea cynaroides TaxID=273540 RepID=A0A9Q0KJV9_9MAGN|nr:hypothetical protein NE237_004909 [Protea cynaroides]